ncbi:hypothetical protein PUN28_008594 [Cardiocondyla obscurior]|uniref:Secreted protein n=1 Tax=Cardiocondyla obscurior TaxID=286306 RepID=A0AAW2G4K6_9HYME
MCAYGIFYIRSRKKLQFLFLFFFAHVNVANSKLLQRYARERDAERLTSPSRTISEAGYSGSPLC